MCLYIYTLILSSGICPERQNLQEFTWKGKHLKLYLSSIAPFEAKRQGWKDLLWYPLGNYSDELQKKTRISVTVVLQLVAPARDVPALLPQYGSKKPRKDCNPSPQAPGLLASVNWAKADLQVCCRSCQLHDSFPSSVVASVFIHNCS